jgi:hypothetical protein
VVQFEPVLNAFAVSDNEDYIYYALFPGANVMIVQARATDGVYVAAVSTSTYNSNVDLKIYTNPPDTATFFTTAFLGNSYVWKWWPNDSGRDWNSVAEWIPFLSHKIPLGVVPIDHKEFYIVVPSSATASQLYFGKLDFIDANIELWATHISCPDTNCDATSAELLIDSTSTKIYTFIEYNSQILFFTFDVTNGALIGTMFATSASVTWNYVSAMTMVASKIYLTFHCDTYYVEVFDTTSSSFTDYLKTTNTNVHLVNSFTNFGFGYFIGSWCPNGKSGYVSRVLYTNLDSGPHIEATTTSLFSSTAAYPIVSDVITSKSLIGFLKFDKIFPSTCLHFYRTWISFLIGELHVKSKFIILKTILARTASSDVFTAGFAMASADTIQIDKISVVFITNL